MVTHNITIAHNKHVKIALVHWGYKGTRAEVVNLTLLHSLSECMTNTISFLLTSDNKKDLSVLTYALCLNMIIITLQRKKTGDCGRFTT